MPNEKRRAFRKHELAPRFFDAGRLEVAAELANAPPVSEWTKEQVVKVQRDRLPLLLLGAASSPLPVALPTSISFSRKDIPRVKERTEVMLERFLAKQPVSVSVTGKDLVDAALVVNVARHGEGVTAATVRGPRLKVFELTLAFLLASPAGLQVRRCGDHRCQHIFVRWGKRDYCREGGCGFFCRSKGCGNRLHQEQWRERQHGTIADANGQD